MELIYTKSKWEMWDDPLETFLQRAASDGFDAVEVFLPALTESPAEIKHQVAAHGLRLVAQIVSDGDTPEAHLASMRERIDFAMETEPLFINSHTGRDIFSFEDNCEILSESSAHAAEHGLLLTHETHRGRPTYTVPDTVRYIEALPDMKLNADFSHWFCVHESDLSDQSDNVTRAIERSWHIHARVGYSEGPQVADPLAPEWLEVTRKFVDLWQRIIDTRKADKAKYLTITPEFGPPPYMPCEPHTGRPLADAWEVNVAFMHFLKKQLWFK